MPQARIWFTNNDMLVRLDTVRSSTMTSTQYLNSSTGVSVSIWSTQSTGSTAARVVTALNMPYVTGSNGRYQVAVQSTAHSMAVGTIGFCEIDLSHSGLTGEWRPRFRVDLRYAS